MAPGKIVELNGIHNFRREYPATPERAFSAEVPGAHWKREQIDNLRVREHPVLTRIVVAVTRPAVTSRRTTSRPVVVGIDARSTAMCSRIIPGGIAPRRGQQAVALYRQYKADSRGRSEFRRRDGGEHHPVVDRQRAGEAGDASRGKHARANGRGALRAGPDAPWARSSASKTRW